MTEENQKRRDFLLQIESIVRETLETQPEGDDPVRCGRALDRGIVRIDEVVAKYRAEWPGTSTLTAQCTGCGRTVQCTGCGRTVPWEQVHVVAIRRQDGTVSQGCNLLCDKCHAALAEPSGIPSWTMSGRHG